MSGASRRANGVRSDRRERRHEGYPPAGTRPRSGLGRVARSRSDAPRLLAGIPAPVTSFSTIITDPIGTIVCTTDCFTVIVNSIGGNIVGAGDSIDVCPLSASGATS